MEEATQQPSFSSMQGSVRGAVAKVLEVNLQDKKYAAPSVQEWTSAISSQTVAALRGISGSFKYTVQKICRKVANYHDVYNAGLTGSEAVQKRKTYKSHRKPAPSEYINPNDVRIDAKDGRRSSHQFGGVLGTV